MFFSVLFSGDILTASKTLRRTVFHSDKQPTVSNGALVTELRTGKGVSVGMSKSTFAFFDVVGLFFDGDMYLQHTKPALGELFLETPSQ